MLKKYPFSASAALKEPIVSEMFPCVVAKGSSRETIFDLLSVSDAEEETGGIFCETKLPTPRFRYRIPCCSRSSIARFAVMRLTSYCSESIFSVQNTASEENCPVRMRSKRVSLMISYLGFVILLFLSMSVKFLK